MWILCGGMQRSASTLQYQIASEIVEFYGLGERVTWYPPKEHPMVFDTHNTFSYYKVFKSHVYSTQIDQEFKNRNALGLYIFRDIRDVLSSMKEKNRCDYSDDQIVTITNQLMKNYRLWTETGHTYVSKYEDAISDLVSEIRNIANYLDVAVDEHFVTKTALQFSIQNQKIAIEACANKSGIVTVNAHNRYDPHSLLHLNHISSGNVGRYKENLSAEQIWIINDLTQTWLLSNGYAL
jgi:hypothetical protein